jgi:hypothetical protein
VRHVITGKGRGSATVRDWTLDPDDGGFLIRVA